MLFLFISVTYHDFIDGVGVQVISVAGQGNSDIPIISKKWSFVLQAATRAE